MLAIQEAFEAEETTTNAAKASEEWFEPYVERRGCRGHDARGIGRGGAEMIRVCVIGISRGGRGRV
jgi:hypothetical protein